MNSWYWYTQDNTALYLVLIILQGLRILYIVLYSVVCSQDGGTLLPVHFQNFTNREMGVFLISCMIFICTCRMGTGVQANTTVHGTK